MIGLARRFLFEDPARLLTSLGGIVFAVVLVLVQVGIYNGFVRSSTLLIEESTADLWISGREMLFLEVTLPISYSWLAKAKTVDGVARAEPLIIRTIIWKNASGTLDYARVVGFDPAGTLLQIDEHPTGDLLQVAKPHAFAIDAAQLHDVGVSGIGAEGTIRSKPARLVALTHGTQPMISPTFFYTSLRNAVAWSPLIIDEFVRDPFLATYDQNSPLQYILVGVTPGSAVERVRLALERALPGSHAFTRQEMMDITRRYWVKRTSIGFILGLVAILGIFVGIVVVAQILYASVNEHLRDYGTLKALGVPDRTIYGSIVAQAVALALLGFVPGLAASIGVVAFARSAEGLVILITPAGAAEVLALTVAMCILAGLFAVRRAITVDPVIVFKA
jgi:putative ABC transport system permease protein